MIKKVLTAGLLSLIGTSGFAASVSFMNGDHEISSYQSGIMSGTYGHTLTRYEDTTTAWGNAIAAGDTIIVEQSGDDGAGANLAALDSFVSGGGRLIVFGGSGNQDLLDALFGGNLTDALGYTNSFTKTAAAAGTTFADDVATLVGLSSTHSLGGALPTGSTVFYEGSTGGSTGNPIVTRTTKGAGDVFYLGFDFCCAGTDQQRNDWAQVLDSAITFDGGDVSTIPLPATGWLLIAGLGGVASLRKRKKA
ncbi:VPLPA-CTERM sorting domain-containing protein [Roseovarius sp. EL26]|uniref:VPLPA-CTERM sorting domain-containing protein n=1 Tax=Roseovarius sp. EL26 TaxID=2126672 RepID=UPI000EA14F4E|nr:VPLPA-CTERM sorting domain-containing protein [Roseovarius sp. EL26]